MPAELSESACCRNCDYLLRGLPSNVCPECGRDFDLANPHSYAVMPRRLRFRRRILRIAAVTATLAILAAVAPRGFRRGEITFECKTCGAQRSIVRWEAASPTWTGLRYPSWASRGDVRTECEVPESTQYEIAYDRHDDVVEFRVPRGNNAAAVRFGIVPGEIASCNGLSINEENAVAILDRLMDPNSRRIRFQSTQLTGPSSFIVPGKP